MATAETQQIDEIISSTRRRMMAMGGTALAGLALAGIGKANAQSTTTAPTDNDILNFALSLEFLGANYYSLGLNGVTIDKGTPAVPTGTGGGTTGGGTVTVKANPQVPFVLPVIKSFVGQLLSDEVGHVLALQAALGTNAVAMANIDLLNSFPALCQAAGIPAFDPFANDLFFMLGAFVFEDNDTSAYHGSAGLITSKTILGSAVAIHATEAQHAGLVRNVIASVAVAAASLYPNLAQDAALVLQGTEAIAALRAKLSAPAGAVMGSAVFDTGVGATTVSLESGSYQASTVVDADPSNTGTGAGFSIAPGRTPTQVLNVVTNGNAGGAKSPANFTGGFFPNGINGTNSQLM